MFKIVLFALGCCVIFIIVKSNIHIRWGTFFKKGFKKLDNLFGIVCYCAKQRKTEKHIAQLIFARSKASKIIMKLLQT